MKRIEHLFLAFVLYLHILTAFGEKSSKKAVHGTLVTVNKKPPPNSLVISEKVVRRPAVIGQSHFWPGGVVPYKIDDNLAGICVADDTYGTRCFQDVFDEALKEIAGFTCINFRQRTTEADYVTFTRGSDSECSSELGKSGGEQQTLLGSFCWYVGTVLHELLHVLGFNHEQNRIDRDQYVKIDWSNILDGAEGNFAKVNDSGDAPTGGQTYDLGSIMHYPAEAFAKNAALPTIQVVADAADEGAAEEMGQRYGLSEFDVAKMQSVYGCNATGDVSFYVGDYEYYDCVPEETEASSSVETGNSTKSKKKKKKKDSPTLFAQQNAKQFHQQATDDEAAPPKKPKKARGKTKSRQWFAAARQTS